VIRLHPDRNPMIIRETLLHETLHACASVAGLDHELGAELATTPTVSMADGLVTFTVEVRVPRVAPFFPATVTRVVIEPLERTTTEADR